MAMVFIKPGLYAAFRDVGRMGYLDSGIGCDGAMDLPSLMVLNAILGNAQDEAAVEFHYPGPEIWFDEPCTIGITGADFGPVLNGIPVENNRPINIKLGDVLKFSGWKNGQRAYLGVSGGFNLSAWLGSKSSAYGHNLISPGFSVGINEHIPVKSIREGASRCFLPDIKEIVKIRFVKGPEWSWLDDASKESIGKYLYVISLNSDRMGYRLKGEEPLTADKRSLLSSPVSFGTIQLPPDGEPLILMAGAQTTGGYPRLGFVVRADLPVLAQCGPGQRIQLEMTNVEEAEALWLALLQKIRRLYVTVLLKRK